MRNYFDSISKKQKWLTIKDFEKQFKSKSHTKAIYNTLYNFMDKDKKGYLEFNDFLKTVYPELTIKNLKTVKLWMKIIDD